MKKMKEEDKKIWQEYIASVTPLERTHLPCIFSPPLRSPIKREEQEKSLLTQSQKGLLKANERTLSHLKRGLMKVEATLDLHGLTQEEAYKELKNFILKASYEKYRCVRVVTGKGASSPGKGGVLKRMVPQWLEEYSGYLYAYSEAFIKDGGAGALYLFLKRL